MKSLVSSLRILVVLVIAGAALTMRAAAHDPTPAPQPANAGGITQIKLAHEGGTQPLTTTPAVGTPDRKYNPTLIAGTEPVEPGEMRVTILGSCDPFVKVAQACASVLIQVGNKECDFFFFDLGSGSLANFNGLKLPVAETTKLFLTHLHADHVGGPPPVFTAVSRRKDSF
ncbi:MAG: hypothetical protein WCQ16_12165 [Verrucomicrobiae bacterium]